VQDISFNKIQPKLHQNTWYISCIKYTRSSGHITLSDPFDDTSWSACAAVDPTGCCGMLQCFCWGPQFLLQRWFYKITVITAGSVWIFRGCDAFLLAWTFVCKSKCVIYKPSERIFREWNPSVLMCHLQTQRDPLLVGIVRGWCCFLTALRWCCSLTALQVCDSHMY
jgi:hypothetical protein